MTTTTWYVHQVVFAQRAIFNSALERTGCFATLAKGKWFVLKMVAQLIMWKLMSAVAVTLLTCFNSRRVVCIIGSYKERYQSEFWFFLDSQSDICLFQFEPTVTGWKIDPRFQIKLNVFVFSVFSNTWKLVYLEVQNLDLRLWLP